MVRTHSIVYAALALVLLSCSRPDDAPVKINAVRISDQEFNTQFKISTPQDQWQSPSARREFLEETINRKLMLLEAERLGLDRDPQFLKEVQDFWQERLLKSTLRLKSAEYRQKVQVTDDEIRQYFDQHPESFGGKALQDASEDIRQILSRIKQQEMMEGWLKALRDNADIKIDYSKIGIEP